MKIVVATGNAGKLKEFGELFRDTGIALVAQGELSVPEAEETGLSFIENAIIKARNASAATGLAALADDSGLEVEALDGQPGIRSARFSADYPDGASDANNNDKLLRLLKDVADDRRNARFVCALAYLRHAADPNPLISVGNWQGVILKQPEGAGGFGYDPLFFDPALGSSAAALPAGKKNSVSHRARALAQLRVMLEQQAIM